MIKQIYNKDIIIQQVKKFIELNNKFPNQSDLQRNKGFEYGYTRIKDLFGGIPNLKRAVDWVDFKTVITDEDYIKLYESKGVKNGECLEWVGVQRNGYGAATYKDKLHTIHRLIWELYNKQKIESGLVVRHLCNNKLCYNVKHLQPGTTKENTADMLSYSKAVKLKPEQVKEMLFDWFTNKDIISNTYGATNKFDNMWAEKFSVGRNAIAGIRLGHRWVEVYKTAEKEFYNGKSK